MGSSCKTCGTALPPWHRTYAHSGSYSAGRKTHCRESRLWRSLRSTCRSAARAPSAFPSPCRKDAHNISNVTCFQRNNHYYHGLLGYAPFGLDSLVEGGKVLDKAKAFADDCRLLGPSIPPDANDRPQNQDLPVDFAHPAVALRSPHSLRPLLRSNL